MIFEIVGNSVGVEDELTNSCARTSTSWVVISGH